MLLKESSFFDICYFNGKQSLQILVIACFFVSVKIRECVELYCEHL